MHKHGIDHLRHITKTLRHENEFVLDSLPTIGSVVDYVGLLDAYQADNLTDIGAAIEQGDSPDDYYTFVEKHGLTWRRHAAVPQKTETA